MKPPVANSKAFPFLSWLTCLAVGVILVLILYPVRVDGGPDRDPNSPGNKRMRAYKAKYNEAEAMSLNPSQYAEAERLLKELLVERPGNERLYLMLGSLYQAQGDIAKSVAAFDRYLSLEGGWIAISLMNARDGYAMYLTYKKAGRESDSREALKRAIERQSADPDVTYTETWEAPSDTVISIVEFEAAREMDRGKEHERAIALFMALSEKDSLTPKMMMELASRLESWGKREQSIKLLIKVLKANSPESIQAKTKLSHFGLIKSEGGLSYTAASAASKG